MSGYQSPFMKVGPYGSNFDFSSPFSAPENPAQSTGPYGAGSPMGAGFQAANFNLGQAGNLQQLSDIINSIQRNAQQAALQARIPGEAGLEAKSSATIGQELAGQVPTDVTNLLARAAAERGVGRGFGPTSPNANAQYLQALGLTSIGQQQLGQQNLSAATGRNPAAPIFDPSSQLISPYQGALLQMQGNQLATQAQLEALRLAQQAALAQQNRYANPGGGYGGYQIQPPGPTGADLFGNDYGATGVPGTPGATGMFGGSSSYGTEQYGPPDYYGTGEQYGPTDYSGSQNWFDDPGYASTPDSMYG